MFELEDVVGAEDDLTVLVDLHFVGLVVAFHGRGGLVPVGEENILFDRADGAESGTVEGVGLFEICETKVVVADEDLYGSVDEGGRGKTYGFGNRLAVFELVTEDENVDVTGVLGDAELLVDAFGNAVEGGKGVLGGFGIFFRGIFSSEIDGKIFFYNPFFKFPQR